LVDIACKVGGNGLRRRHGYCARSPRLCCTRNTPPRKHIAAVWCFGQRHQSACGVARATGTAATGATTNPRRRTRHGTASSVEIGDGQLVTGVTTSTSSTATSACGRKQIEGDQHARSSAFGRQNTVTAGIGRKFKLQDRLLNCVLVR
jgi:hypothetical protein